MCYYIKVLPEGCATSLHPKKKNTKKRREFWFFEYLKESLTKAQKVRAANENTSEFREGTSNKTESFMQVSQEEKQNLNVLKHELILS